MSDFKLEPWHVGALERCIETLSRQATDLMEDQNYNCMFFEADAESLQQILDYLRVAAPK